MEIGDWCAGGTLVNLLDGSLETHLVEGCFGADLSEQCAADAVGFYKRGRARFAACEVSARGTLVLESFQFLQRPLQCAFMARGVSGESFQRGARIGIAERVRDRAEQIGFVHATAAEVPLGVDNRLKMHEFEFADGDEFGRERGLEGGENRGFFVIGDVELARAEPVNTGVLRGAGFAVQRGGTGGPEGVEAIGFELFRRS